MPEVTIIDIGPTHLKLADLIGEDAGQEAQTSHDAEIWINPFAPESN